MNRTVSEIVQRFEPGQTGDLRELLASAGIRVDPGLSVSAAFDGEALVVSVGEAHPVAYTRRMTCEIRAENPGIYLDDLLEQAGVELCGGTVFAMVDDARHARVIVER